MIGHKQKVFEGQQGHLLARWVRRVSPRQLLAKLTIANDLNLSRQQTGCCRDSGQIEECRWLIKHFFDFFRFMMIIMIMIIFRNYVCLLPSAAFAADLIKCLCFGSGKLSLQLAAVRARNEIHLKCT